MIDRPARKVERFRARHRWIWWLAAAAVLRTSAAAAQDQPPDLTVPALSSAALAEGTTVQKLLGADVYARDAHLGSIDDVILDLHGGRILAVIVRTSGMFDSRRVAVPAAAVKVGGADRLTIDLPLGAFDTAPEYVEAPRSVVQ